MVITIIRALEGRVLPDEIRKCSRGQARNAQEFHQNFMTPKKRNIVFVIRPLNTTICKLPFSASHKTSFKKL